MRIEIKYKGNKRTRERSSILAVTALGMTSFLLSRR